MFSQRKYATVALFVVLGFSASARAQMMGGQGSFVSGISSQRVYAQPAVQPQAQTQQPTQALVSPWAQPTQPGTSGVNVGRMITLFPGFSPDPTTNTLVAGGSVQGAQFGPNCRGVFGTEPQSMWVSTSLPVLRVMARSNSVVSLAVRAPNGVVFCAGGITLSDAVLDLRSVATGGYQVFVGTSGGTAPATVGFSKDLVFSLLSLPLPATNTIAVAPPTAPMNITTTPQSAVTAQPNGVNVPVGWVTVGADSSARAPVAGSPSISTPPSTSTTTPTPTGLHVAADSVGVQRENGAARGRVALRFLARQCLGFGDRRPSTSFVVREGVTWLRAAIHADQDSTLALRAPNGAVMCADDVYGVHPGIDLTSPVAGRWEVFVGTYAPRATVQYEFAVSTDHGFAPRAD